MSSTNVDNIGQIHSEGQKTEKKPLNPAVLSDDDIKKIPESEKKELVRMPGEPDCLWANAVKDGTILGWNVPKHIMARHMPVFYSMIEALEPTNKSHVVFGGFKYAFTDPRFNNVFRSKYSGTNSSGFKPRPPKFIEKVFFGSPGEVNDFLEKEENKGKWELIPSWHVDDNKEITVGIVKNN